MDIEQLAATLPQDRGHELLDALRQKWREVPGGLESRVHGKDLLNLSERELREFWEGVHAEASIGQAFTVRGWYHVLYQDVFRGRRVLEVGSGMGIDALHFIRHGARWHCADIVADNLELIRRQLAAFGLKADGFSFIEDFGAFDRIPGQFDFIFCQGSLINLPFEAARLETLHILPRLKPGGRWVELCYPRERWVREGRMPASRWGEVTDGVGTPWMEWYDLDRLADRFWPVQVEALLAFNFHGDDFNWFDLRVPHTEGLGSPEQLASVSRPVSVMLSFTAAKATTHSGAAIIPLPDDAAARVITGSLRWSYAANIELPDAASLGFSDTTELEARVALNVLEGSIGLGVLNASLSSYVGAQRFLDAAEEEKIVRLPYPATRTQPQLMVRNGAQDGQKSCVDLKAIVVSARPAWGERTNDAGWNEVQNLPALNLTALVQRYSEAGSSHAAATLWKGVPVFVRAVGLDALAAELNYATSYAPAAHPALKSPLDWRMEEDDAPILAFLYRQHRPRRHLEFGTWEGFGAMLCAENCEAEIWTVNLPEGERAANGSPVYQAANWPHQTLVGGDLPAPDARGVYVTDAGAFIGWRYRAAGHAARIHQILADSRDWAGAGFADGFFDSVLIDGGHASEVVTADTGTALRLVRRGGLVLWHDFCPLSEVMEHQAATRSVVGALHANWRRWAPYLEQLFWVRPSFVLIGIRS